jgi:hypothetical protein
LNSTYFAEIQDHSRIERAQFRMNDYGLFFRPTREALICFDASKINHGTTENTGYKQYEVAVLVKPIVLKVGLKPLKQLGF